LLGWKHLELCWLCRVLCRVYQKVHDNHRCSDCDYPRRDVCSWIILSVKLERQEAEQKYLYMIYRILYHILHIIPGSGPISCHDIDTLHGPEWSKKGNGYFVERCRQIATHARKAAIAVNALGGSSSEKDASWTVNVTEMARTSELRISSLAWGGYYGLQFIHTLQELSLH
jgi:hypothetical protein